MHVETISFDVEGFDGGIQSRRIGDLIEISYARWPVMGFNIKDTLARDWTIASLLETPLKGKTIAALCHTRPAQVSKVKDRLRHGGFEALARKRRGRKALLVGPRLKRALELRRQGLSIEKIAEELGLSVGCVAKRLKGIPRGGQEPQQQELDDLDCRFHETQEAEGDDEPAVLETSSELEEASDDEDSKEDQEMAVEVLVEALSEAEQLLAKETEGVEDGCPPPVDEPDAKRAWLKTKNRSLLQPLKYVLANGRRWLLSVLGSALAPSDGEWDQSAVSRTLAALIRAPGTVRFDGDGVVVTLELPLPPQPHARLSQGLIDLDGEGLLFTDGLRRVRFRLAPRPTRQDLPSGEPMTTRKFPRRN